MTKKRRSKDDLKEIDVLVEHETSAGMCLNIGKAGTFQRNCFSKRPKLKTRPFLQRPVYQSGMDLSYCEIFVR
jgi:hypothetical protein